MQDRLEERTYPSEHAVHTLCDPGQLAHLGVLQSGWWVIVSERGMPYLYVYLCVRGCLVMCVCVCACVCVYIYPPLPLLTFTATLDEINGNIKSQHIQVNAGHDCR